MVEERYCPECGGPLLFSHGVLRCPSREHEPYAEEILEAPKEEVTEENDGPISS